MNEWRYFCEKPPKGFEKYFKPGGKDSPKDVKPAEKEGKDAKGKSEPKSEPPPQTRPSSSSSGGSGGSKPYDQWSFGLFGGTGNRLIIFKKSIVLM